MEPLNKQSKILRKKNWKAKIVRFALLYISPFLAKSYTSMLMDAVNRNTSFHIVFSVSQPKDTIPSYSKVFSLICRFDS